MTLILGCSPLVAGRQFGDRAVQYRDRFSSADALVAVWRSWTEAGGRAVHLVDEPGLLAAFASWPGRHELAAVWLTVGEAAWRPVLQTAAGLGVTGVLRHARQVDAGESLDLFLGDSRAAGFQAGAVTHAPCALGRVAVDLPDDAPLMVPYNFAGLFMDGPPEEARTCLGGRRARLAMMTLGAGRLGFAPGVGYAAAWAQDVVVGAGSAERAAELAGWEGAVAALAEPGRRVQRVPRRVDVSEAADEVMLLRDHDALRLRDGALAVWRLLEEPCSLDDLSV